VAEKKKGEKPRSPLTGTQVVLVVLAILIAMVGVTIYLLVNDFVLKKDGITFYGQFVEAIVILGGAALGVPIAWRTAKEAGKQEGATSKAKDVAERLAPLATQLRRGRESVSDPIRTRFAIAPNEQSFLVDSESVRTEPLRIDVAGLEASSDAVAKIEQLVEDLRSG
jgi:hypothetical protein